MRKKPGSEVRSMVTQLVSDRDESEPRSDSQIQAISS